MSTRLMSTERRSEPRERSDLTVRWKRPGLFEDLQGWTIDRSPAGLGFLVPTGQAPLPGEMLNVRYWDRDRWATIDRPVRVARVTPDNSHEMMMVGCRIE